jgi:nicotinamide mononucleotide adenylyltransferase
MKLKLERDKPTVNKTIVVYSGRFQPFHKGHYISYQKLVSKFG